MRHVLLLMLALGVWGLSGCSSGPTAPSEVFVRARDYSTVKVLQDSQSLRTFSSLWYDRAAIKSAQVNWDDAYKLDIPGEGMWLYQSDGYATLMSMKTGTVYEVKDPAALNTLLGVREVEPKLASSPGR
jgi:hypothetical protein